MNLELARSQLDLLALAALRAQPLHGYAIIKEIHERSGGELELAEGTLYPGLHRLERAGLVKSSWTSESGRRRRVYQLTAKGQRALAARQGEWRQLVRTVDAVIRGTA
jgi:PadR family transcriptional regulator, regulatory protein PadR